MMISPSENGGAKVAERSNVSALPVRLLGGAVREVSRLEFSLLGRPEIVAEVASDQTDVLLKEEVAALDRRLRSQEEQRSVDLQMARSEARAEARIEWQQELEATIAEERKA